MSLNIKQHISHAPQVSDFIFTTLPNIGFDSGGLTTLETLFYTAAAQTNSKNEVVKLVNQYALTYFEQIRFVFCVSNIASSLYFYDKKILQLSNCGPIEYFFSAGAFFSGLIILGAGGFPVENKIASLFYKLSSIAKCLTSVKLLTHQENYLGFLSNFGGGLYNLRLNFTQDSDEFVKLVQETSKDKKELVNFESVQACYNLFQSILISLQKYPEFKKSIADFQCYSIVFDLVSLAATLNFFYNSFDENRWESFEERKRKEKFFFIAAASISVLSLFLSYYINQYLKSKINIDELLDEMGLSQQIRDNTKLAWETPMINLYVQAVAINRFIATLLLTCRSPSKANFVSLAALGYNFHGLCNLNWIRLKQTILDPAKKALELGGKCDYSVSPSGIATLEWGTSFMISSPCTNDKEHMKSIVKSILNYADNLLKGSSWDSYWHIVKKNGFVDSQSLIYGIKLMPQNQPSCTCSLVAEVASGLLGTITEKVARSYYVFLTPTKIAQVHFL